MFINKHIRRLAQGTGDLTNGSANWSWAIFLGTQLIRPNSAQPLGGGFP